ncbi:DUF4097 family beta strand repeat-containing protein [Streptomyces vietnamensis]|uniref:DUF4097 domain-containing protein n=1 Tax=Streptomyces vietnamensis TaxID=362257 RepID=A0A0B5I2E4_9ACTN|nr:DUF4097 family beta strand repeat-containing protein [Streptomyces vietnamensis]AJF68315.1 hypothetical protein SVTN_32115 [Streptomyces vietnamensis]
MRRGFLLIGLAVLVTVVAAAGWGVVALLPAHHPYSGNWQQDATGAGQVTVQTDGLDVTLSQDGSSQVTVAMSGNYTGHVPQVSVTRSGSDVTVTAGCSNDCSEHLQITVPAGLAAQVNTGDAGIRAKGLTGRLDLTTELGEVEVDRSSGPLTVRSTYGAVTLADSSAPNAEVITTDGAVSASFRAAPASLKVTAGYGGVDLKVPHDATYRVDAQSSQSSPSVSLPNTATDAPHSVVVKTTGGDITVH